MSKPHQRLDKDGNEVLSKKPAAVPLGFEKPETLEQTIARLVNNRLIQKQLDEQGHETFEEANDFNVDDDFDPNSPWEEHFEGQREMEMAILEEYKNQEGKNSKTPFQIFREKWFKKHKKEIPPNQPPPVSSHAVGGVGGEAPSDFTEEEPAAKPPKKSPTKKGGD